MWSEALSKRQHPLGLLAVLGPPCTAPGAPQEAHQSASAAPLPVVIMTHLTSQMHMRVHMCVLDPSHTPVILALMLNKKLFSHVLSYSCLHHCHTVRCQPVRRGALQILQLLCSR